LEILLELPNLIEHTTWNVGSRQSRPSYGRSTPLRSLSALRFKTLATSSRNPPPDWREATAGRRSPRQRFCAVGFLSHIILPRPIFRIGTMVHNRRYNCKEFRRRTTRAYGLAG
jgi:hypothetical protein